MIRHRNFILQLGLCFIVACVIIITFNLNSVVFSKHQFLSWAGLSLFSIISIFAYILGLKTAKSSNKNEFNNVLIILMAAKMLICLFLVWLYQIFMSPQSKLFIIPFFITYFIFTLFESYVLIKLGRMEDF